MLIKALVDEDFVNYKLPCMFIGFPSCTFKCEKECPECKCQNSELAKSRSINMHMDDIVKRYMDNPITSSIVCGGLEPMDSFENLVELIRRFRKFTNDDIVIFTGYNEFEIIKEVNVLKTFQNIIIKFGRYIPNKETHYDETLGIKLASPNQYAKRIN